MKVKHITDQLIVAMLNLKKKKKKSAMWWWWGGGVKPRRKLEVYKFNISGPE